VLARAVAALLAESLSLLHIISRAKAGTEPEDEGLTALLKAVAPAVSLPLSMMIAMIMALLPRPERFIGVADAFVGRQNDPTLRATSDRAIDFVLEGIERSPMPGADVAQAANDVRRVAIMLADLKLCSAQRPGRQNRVEQVRRCVDAACCERFASELKQQLLAPAADLATAGDDTMAVLEATARDLRRFEMTARQIGGADQDDRQLEGAAHVLRPVAGEDALARISRIRLVETLRGPDAAMEILTAATG
jgi:hypothetical protein